MKGILSIIFIFSQSYLAMGLGPPGPGSLLPPIKPQPLSQMKEPKDAFSPELDPIFDLEDPSQLLEIDEQVLVDPTENKPPETAYDKKLSETAKKLIPPQGKGLNDVPTLADKRPLIPQLPLLATTHANTPKPLQNKGPTPLLPVSTPPSAPSHPPLLSAMTPSIPNSSQYSFPPVPPPPPTERLSDFSLMPMMAGVGAFSGANRDPSSEAVPHDPAQVTAMRLLPKTTVQPPLPGVPDIAVILSNNQFFPSKIRIREGTQTRLIFTTTNKKPAALIMERLQIQRWIAKEKDHTPSSELDRAKWEVNRELSASKVTEIVLDPKPGTYTFHDAISGASGEIEVERK